VETGKCHRVYRNLENKINNMRPKSPNAYKKKIKSKMHGRNWEILKRHCRLTYESLLAKKRSVSANLS
jgi:hypothetical protein